MAERFTIKQGDLEPPLAVVLRDGEGNPVDLSLALAVRVIIERRNETLVDGPAVIADQTGNPGLVSRPWQTGETNTSGTYQAEFEVMWPGNRPQTFPTKGYVQIVIGKDLG